MIPRATAFGLTLVLLASLFASCGEDKSKKKVKPVPDDGKFHFSGLSWEVKTSGSEVAGPGPNYFSDSEDNVWVDSDGALHLRIERRGGVWYCAEIWSVEALGYGEYSFLLDAGADQIDENAVLGLFTWDDHPAEHNREIDIELSRWHDPNNDNSQFVVQPYDTPGNMQRFESDLNGESSTYRFDWQASRIGFGAQVGTADPPASGDIIEEWEYSGADIPTPGDARTHLNLWLYQGRIPSDGEPVEVVINEFRFGD
jgi:hypothetical protein